MLRPLAPLLALALVQPALAQSPARKWPLERMSSGALLRLDRDGDLVKPPSGRAAPQLNEGAMLDPRVGPNVRLGDDPSALPPTLRAQAEPHVARSRVDADVIVATFQEGRFTNGGAVTCGYALSENGGKTWTRALIPGLAVGQGGPYQRATDPVVAFTRSGTVVFNNLSSVTSAFQVAAVTITRGDGTTFSAPVEVYRSPADGSIIPDKNWLAINANASGLAAGRMLVTWTQFLPGENDPSPIVRSYSDDGGNTWTAPAPVHAAGTFAQGSQPLFLPDGRAAIVYWNFGQAGVNGVDQRIECVTSADGGVTYAAPVRAASAQLSSEPAIRTGSFLPSAVADETTNSIYVAYVSRETGTPRVMFVRSANAGATWGTPIAVSDNPTGTGVFNPAIAVSADGTRVAIVFHDRRLNPASNVLYDTFLAQSSDGGVTWGPNLRLSSMSSDASLAPLTGAGYMVGDYLGLAAPTTPQIPAVPVWIDTRTGNPDPFSARVAVASTFDYTAWQSVYFTAFALNNPAVVGPTADPDNDGEDNLAEFTARTNPTDSTSVQRSSKAINLSTRARAQTGENLVIGGFVIAGTQPKAVIIRAVGPSLADFGITDPLLDPNLEIRDAGGNLLAFNEDWRDTQATELQASGLAPRDARESAIRLNLAPGSYTALVRGRAGSAGVAVVEAYDVSPEAASRLVNVSTRARVEGGQNVTIGGFVVGAGAGSGGAGSVRVVVRAIGPSLAAAGVTAPLLDPTLELRAANGDLLAGNDNWQDTQAAELTATGLAPTDSREAAIVRVLPRGSYTAVVRGKDGAVGVALVEVYEVP